jgi:hypothetical protein
VILVMALVLFLGYAVWRQSRLLRACRELEGEGASLTYDAASLWPKVPQSASVRFVKTGTNRFANGGDTYSAYDAWVRYDFLAKRLREAGVEKVYLWLEVNENGKSKVLLLHGGANLATYSDSEE